MAKIKIQGEFMMWLLDVRDMEESKKEAVKYFADKYGVMPEYVLPSCLKNHLAIGPIHPENHLTRQ